jgi:outer membrane protein assembly factor BamB
MATSSAADWPQWRGAHRDGQIAGFTPPQTWPKDLATLWKIEVGEGHSTPIVVGELVFEFSRVKEEETLRAMSLADGKEIWKKSYPAPYKVNFAAIRHGKGPKSTPVYADGRVFTLGISGILSAWDAASGERLWQKEFSKAYKETSPLYGTAMSPVVEGGLVIAHVGGHDGGALAAFDVKSGDTRWQWDGDGPAYTSPIVLSLDGTRQIVTQSQKFNLGVAAGDGTVLWKTPFETPYEQNIVTPLVVGELVLFAGLGKPTIAYRIEKTDGRWGLKEVWQNKDLALYMNSPIVVGDRIVAMNNKQRGTLVCAEAASGKTVWTSEGNLGDNSSLVAAGELALMLTTKGQLSVFKPAAAKYEPLATYQVSDKPTYAHPVVVGKAILIKDELHLTKFGLEK